MPFRERFDCLWCGREHRVTSPADLEGWSQLCPDCLGKASGNAFVRARVKGGIAERAKGMGGSAEPATPGSPGRAATTEATTATATAATAQAPRETPSADAEMLAYYAARVPEYDDWYLRRGRYSHGAIEDMAWQADLDQATLWLDRLPIAGRIVELAAGTGWWSPLLAQKGELWLSDALEAPLERARERLVAHGLRAHLHVRDAWAEPDAQADVLFTGFWLSHVPRDRLGEFLGLARRWLKPGGLYAFIDSATSDPTAGAIDRPAPPENDLARRRLADGREFTIPKVFYAPTDLEAALRAAGFSAAEVRTTNRFFLLGQAIA
jgi:SAM-dependent methyltransferase